MKKLLIKVLMFAYVITNVEIIAGIIVGLLYGSPWGFIITIAVMMVLGMLLTKYMFGKLIIPIKSDLE